MEEALEKAPVFIKIEKYKDVIGIMGLIKEKIANVDKALARIKEIKAKEDAELSSWKASLQTTETKINEVDKSLFEPELP